LSLKKFGLDIEIVPDTIDVFGLFKVDRSILKSRMEELIDKECVRYKWKEMYLIGLNKAGYPHCYTGVFLSGVTDFYYNYCYVIRMVEAVARLSHSSRKYALEHGEFYMQRGTGLLFFTVNWEVWGVLAPIVRKKEESKE